MFKELFDVNYICTHSVTSIAKILSHYVEYLVTCNILASPLFYIFKSFKPNKLASLFG